MSKGENLGEFEQMVLLSLMRLKDNAYGVTVRQEIAARAERDVAIGAVYAALDRLERKKYITSRDSDPEPVRGGRAKRMFAITEAGTIALANARSMMARMAEGLEIETGPDTI